MSHVPVAECINLTHKIFEVLCIKSLYGLPLYVCALYHALNAVYGKSDLLAYRKMSGEHKFRLLLGLIRTFVVIAGDFNQLPD